MRIIDFLLLYSAAGSVTTLAYYMELYFWDHDFYEEKINAPIREYGVIWAILMILFMVIVWPAALIELALVTSAKILDYFEHKNEKKGS